MRISSSAFTEGARIPRRYTCEGKNVSPPLEWGDIPEEAASLALIMSDPDAPGGTFTHWVVYNIPPMPVSLPEGESLRALFPEDVIEGRNDFGRQGYGGPCPPRGGGSHRYFFRLLALNMMLRLKESAGRRDVLMAIRDCLVDEATVMGVYSRS